MSTLTVLTLVARAALFNGFQLPPMTTIDNTTPALNDSGQVAFQILTYDGTTDSAIWLGDARTQSIVYRLPEGLLLSDVSLNASGGVAFHVFDDLRSQGIFLAEKGKSARQVIAPPSKPGLLTTPALSDQGALTVARHEDGTQSVLFDGGREIAVTNQFISYLFSPSMNAAGAWAAKVRLGGIGDWAESQPDEVRAWDREGRSRVLAQDRDALASSPFTAFHNGVDLANDGAAVFVATLADGKNALVLAEKGATRILLTEGEQGVRELERFLPRIASNAGSERWIAFRAITAENRRSIFLGHGDGIWERMVSEGDKVPTDLGPGRILSRTGFPGFSGGISLNAFGEIAFHALVTDPTGAEALGEAIYVASRKQLQP